MVLVAIGGLSIASLYAEPTIWNGPLITFSKPALADCTLAENQDRITDLVWITRASTQGLFNIETELSYVHNLSPAGTEWAYGTTADYASLTYTNWESWAKPPPQTVGKDAVLHLKDEDIYIDIKFTSWGGSGGEFSYVRSTVPEPASTALLTTGACFVILRRRRDHPR